MRILVWLFFTVLVFGSCGNESSPKSEKSIEEVQAEGKISSIIRNPATADESVDTVNVAKIHFEEDTYNFGDVNEGDVVIHTFPFTNTGKVPLVITNARSTCGCTVPDWPKEPIPPGGKSEINVEFNTKNKKRDQTKAVTITANTYPSATKVFLVGYVNPKPAED